MLVLKLVVLVFGVGELDRGVFGMGCGKCVGGGFMYPFNDAEGRE